MGKTDSERYNRGRKPESNFRRLGKRRTEGSSGSRNSSARRASPCDRLNSLMRDRERDRNIRTWRRGHHKESSIGRHSKHDDEVSTGYAKYSSFSYSGDIAGPSYTRHPAQQIIRDDPDLDSDRLRMESPNRMINSYNFRSDLDEHRDHKIRLSDRMEFREYQKRRISSPDYHRNLEEHRNDSDLVDDYRRLIEHPESIRNRNLLEHKDDTVWHDDRVKSNFSELRHNLDGLRDDSARFGDHVEYNRRLSHSPDLYMNIHDQRHDSRSPDDRMEFIEYQERPRGSPTSYLDERRDDSFRSGDRMESIALQKRDSPKYYSNFTEHRDHSLRLGDRQSSIEHQERTRDSSYLHSDFENHRDSMQLGNRMESKEYQKRAKDFSDFHSNLDERRDNLMRLNDPIGTIEYHKGTRNSPNFYGDLDERRDDAVRFSDNMRSMEYQKRAMNSPDFHSRPDTGRDDPNWLGDHMEYKEYVNSTMNSSDCNRDAKTFDDQNATQVTDSNSDLAGRKHYAALRNDVRSDKNMPSRSGGLHFDGESSSWEDRIAGDPARRERRGSTESSDMRKRYAESRTENSIDEFVPRRPETVTNARRVEQKEKTSSAKSGALRKRRNRIVMICPLGTPGAKDDPHRQGMSGAMVRKYHRLLKRGVAPDEARNQVFEGARAWKEKPVPKWHKVGIMPKNYPAERLLPNQVSTIEDLLVEEMCQSEERGIHFNGVQFRHGMMVVNCGSKETKAWLLKVLPGLKSWGGPELKTVNGEDMPLPSRVRIFFPKTHEMDAEEIVRLVAIQNSNLCTDEWEILHANKEQNGTLLLLLIDPISVISIREAGCSIGFRFGRVRVKKLGSKNGSDGTDKMSV